MDNNERALVKAANLCVKKRDYVQAINYYERLGYMENVAALYLKIGSWHKASDIYFNIGMTAKACEIEEKGRKGAYK